MDPHGGAAPTPGGSDGETVTPSEAARAPGSQTTPSRVERPAASRTAVALDALTSSYARELRFWLNGREVRLGDPDPDLLLVDWLRSPGVGLTGTKLVCGQGGCGACTVTLSYHDSEAGRVVHRAVNACLRRVASLDGVAVTTVEGLVVDGRMSPVQYRLAKENGTQCGYCTPGFVMNLHAFLAERAASDPDARPTMSEIESRFTGNICRCTGYRPILYAAKHFARDWDAGRAEDVLVCRPFPGDETGHYEDVRPLVPGGLPDTFRPVRYRRGDRWWIRPGTLDEVARVRAASPSGAAVHLVNGGTAIQLMREWGPDAFAPAGPAVYIDVSRFPSLRAASLEADHLRLGGGRSYADALGALEGAISELDEHRARTLRAVHLAAERTAGGQVRNAASLAGNTILCATFARRGARFPSDMVTALAAMGTTVEVHTAEPGGPTRWDLLDLVRALRDGAGLRDTALITAYQIPLSRTHEFAETHKVARREDDSTAIVNCGLRARLDEAGRVEDASFVFGGIGLLPFHAREAERAVMGRRWDARALAAAVAGLRRDIESIRTTEAEALANLPEDGISPEYHAHLAESFLYKFFVSVALALAPDEVPPAVASAGRRHPRGPSGGHQTVPPGESDGVLGVPYLKEGAFRQATGQAKYTHDLVPPPRTCHAAFVTSERALARFRHVAPTAPAGGPAGNGASRRVAKAAGGTGPAADGAGSAPAEPTPGEGTAAVRAYLSRFEGFVDYLGAEDLPGPRPEPENAAAYDPLLPDGLVTSWGQPVALVVAETERQAIALARRARRECLAYEPVPDSGGRPLPPILGIAEARQRPDGAMPDAPPYPIHIARIERPGSETDWFAAPEEAVVGGVHCHIVRGVMETGTQAQFYLETQAALVVPGEDRHLEIHSSSQWPRGIHDGAASAVGLPSNAVTVRMRRLGGGYGGKTTRTPYVSSPAAVAAARLGRPVRLVLPRAIDTGMIGKRHPFRGEFAVAIGTGRDDPTNRGRLMGLLTDFFADGGSTYDCSMNVMDCAQLQADGAYRVPSYRTTGTLCRTNTASNNAMRSYGVIQCNLIQEEALEAAAHAVGLRPDEVRRRALYESGDETPAGQKLEDCHLAHIWARLEKRVRFGARRAAVEEFNRRNRWRKRGISMLPLKYGLGFYASFLEQGGGMVEVYQADGSILIHHGGVEMGQGLWTRVSQIAARALNVPLDLIRTAATDTSVIADPISTGASTGTMLNGGAVREACRALRARLEAMLERLRAQHGDDWCRSQGVNYWEYPEGWRAEVGREGKKTRMWTKVAALAFQERESLSELVRFKTVKRPFPHGIYFNPGIDEEVEQFDGFTYAAACSEVEIDVLTGETTILRSDILYDLGQSLNPALDIGQIEGAFVQGLGHVLTEEVVFESRGEQRGRNNTLNVMDYKPPGPSTIPLELNVDLFPREAGDPPLNRTLDPNAAGPDQPPPITSKGVGEPPLVLAATAYFAIKQAILAARRDREHESWFRLDTPATVQAIREACLVEAEDLTI